MRIMWLLIFTVSCGIELPEQGDTDDSSSSVAETTSTDTDTDNIEEEIRAKAEEEGTDTCLAAYTLAFEDAVEDTCSYSGCHDQAGGGAPITLDSGLEATVNNQALLDWVGSDIKPFIEKMDGTTSHTGGELLDRNIEESLVRAWFSECQ